MSNRYDENDNAMIFAVAGIIFLLIIMFLINKFQGELNTAFAWFKIIETYPFMWWNSDWSILTDDIINDRRDLGSVEMGVLATFYNRYIAFFWLLVYGFFIYKVFKKPIETDFAVVHTPQSLLNASSRMFSETIPWVHRNIAEECWNTGQWRLMEGPLMFLIKHKAIKDPNGDPFKFNMVYEAGDTPSLYERGSAEKPSVNIPDVELFEPSFDFALKKRNSKSSRKFSLPHREYGTVEEELLKFKNSDLVPSDNSPYLNKKRKAVINTIDERVLKNALAPQLGLRMEGDPFVFLSTQENWRFGLAVALFLHGLSDETKKDAEEIFDCMNKSFAGKKAFDHNDIDIGKAKSYNLNWKNDRRFSDNVTLHFSFTNPFFMALLEYARTRGVVSCASFGWVKAFDRTTWYSLSQTGRSVCSVEAAGPWSHYHAEKAMEKTLSKPYLEMAIQGIRTEMVIEGWLNEKAEKAIQESELEKTKQENFLAEHNGSKLRS